MTNEKVSMFTFLPLDRNKFLLKTPDESIEGIDNLNISTEASFCCIPTDDNTSKYIEEVLFSSFSIRFANLGSGYKFVNLEKLVTSRM